MKAWLAERLWRNESQHFHITIDNAFRTVVRFEGNGSLEGAKALIEQVESIRDMLGAEVKITALVDMRELNTKSVRAQMTLGRWLFSRARQVNGIAVLGRKPLEMALAKGVMTIAGLGQRAWFGGDLDEARRFLGWPVHRYDEAKGEVPTDPNE